MLTTKTPMHDVAQTQMTLLTLQAANVHTHMASTEILTAVQAHWHVATAAAAAAGCSEPFSSFVRISRPEAPAASSNSSISRALVAAAYQLRQKGYNAVYLPFTFTDLHSDSSSSSKRIGSYVCRQLSLQDFVKKRDGNGFTGSSSSSTADAWKTKLVEQVLKDVTTAEVGSQQARKCLTLLPTTTTLDRYLWSVQWFLANGLYVIMSSSSNGVSPACGAATGGSSSSRSASCMQDAAAAADAWVKLWEAVLVLPAFEGSVHGRVMLQLAQEAGSTGQQWEPTSNSAGQEKLPGTPRVLLWFDSCHQLGGCSLSCPVYCCCRRCRLLIGVAGSSMTPSWVLCQTAP
jgi:hypothetical protein